MYHPGDKIVTKRRKTIYVYVENLNRIEKTFVPILSKKKDKELRTLGCFPHVHISINGKEGDLDNFIYASTLKGCEQKIRKYYNKKIKELQTILGRLDKED